MTTKVRDSISTLVPQSPVGGPPTHASAPNDQRWSEGPQVVRLDSEGPEMIQSSYGSEKPTFMHDPHNAAYRGDTYNGGQQENGPVGPQRTKKRLLGLTPLVCGFYALTILVLLAAIAVTVDITASRLQQCKHSLSHLTALNETLSTSTSIPGEAYSSSCSPSETWHSNLTSLDYTQVCNADISHRGVEFTLMAGAIVDTFHACAIMCDTLNWPGGKNASMSVVAWSWSGNSSTGIQANCDGQCWCVQTGTGGYSMNYTLGIDCFLMAGTFDPGAIGTVPDS